MLRKLLFVIMFGAFVCLPLASVQATMHTPTETSFLDPATAYNGVTIVTPFTGKASYFVDNDGRLVHRITSSKGIWYAKPLDNGAIGRTVLVPASQVTDPHGLMTFAGGGWNIEEVGWSGGLRWSFNSYTAQFGQHHDFARIYNKKLKAYTYIFVAWIPKTGAEAAGLGANSPSPNGWSPDSIVEVNSAGQVVWQWSFYEHTCTTNTVADPPNPYYHHVADIASAPGKLDINVETNAKAGAPVGFDWNHINSMDYNQDLDYIVVNSRAVNEFFVVDHGKTFVSTTDFAANIAAAAGPDGDFVYRFGNSFNYNQGAHPAYGTNGATQIWGAHQVQWIQPKAYLGGPALPGAGNFIIFDNGATNANTSTPWTRIPEINPFVNGPPVNGVFPKSASYVNPPTAGYTVTVPPMEQIYMSTLNQSNQIVWVFQSNHYTSFGSAHISGTQRLPNGNTLSCSGEYGHFVEVTPQQNLAWEYINPIANGKPIKFITNPTWSNVNQVFRGYKYDVGHPAFKNRLIQYADGTIQPIAMTVPGVGFTLTGSVACRSIPCQYVGTP